MIRSVNTFLPLSGFYYITGCFLVLNESTTYPVHQNSVRVLRAFSERYKKQELTMVTAAETRDKSYL